MNYIEINGKRHRYRVLHGPDSTSVWLDGRTYYLPKAGQTPVGYPGANSATGEVSALMPGKLLRIEVAVGDTVVAKQQVAIMESMKMESPLFAPKAGRVAEIRAEPGRTVDVGEVVLVIE